MDFSFGDAQIQGGTLGRGTPNVQPHGGSASIAPHQPSATEAATRTAPPSAATNN